MSKKETVAWECAGCGSRHIWKWPKGEALECEITLECEACQSTCRTKLVRVGLHAWAAIWPGR